jgi:hypothetical protein
MHLAALARLDRSFIDLLALRLPLIDGYEPVSR